MSTPLPSNYTLQPPSVGSSDQNPAWYLGTNGSPILYVSGNVNGTPAVFAYTPNVAINGYWSPVYPPSFFGTSGYVTITGTSKITGIGSYNDGSILVSATKGSSSVLYDIAYDNTSNSTQLNTSNFGTSGSITAPTGYTFTGGGGTYYQSVSPYSQIALFTATNSSGASVFLSYNTISPPAPFIEILVV